MSFVVLHPAVSAVSLTVRPPAALAHDYSCIARGQPFVCEHWLDRDLLQALRADVGELLALEGPFMDVNDRMVAGLNPENWAAIGEAAPSAARAQIRQQFEELRVELDGVLDRRLSVGGVGSMAKYSIAPKGLPLGWHVDQRHEAFGQHLRLLEYADLHSDATRRSLAWLLYLSDDDCRGGAMRAYPRADATDEEVQAYLDAKLTLQERRNARERQCDARERFRQQAGEYMAQIRSHYCIFCGKEEQMAVKCCGTYVGMNHLDPNSPLVRDSCFMGRQLCFSSWPHNGDPDAPYVRIAVGAED